MRILDADTHISPTPEGGNSITADELLRRMDRSGVEQALVWIQPPYMRDTAGSNRYVRDSVRLHPDRLMGFGWADPNHGVDAAIAEASRCVKEYGFHGVKLNGAQNSFYIDDPVVSLPVIEAIAAMGKPVAFHVGGDAYEQTHPFRVGKIARMFPETRILAVHMGGAAFADLSNAMIEVAAENPNITLIGSAVRSIPILKAIRVLGADRVCFGSDTPFEPMHVEVAKYKALLEGEIGPEDIGLVMAGNMLRILGV